MPELTLLALRLVSALSATSPGAAGENANPVSAETIFCADQPFTSLDMKPEAFRVGKVYSVLNRQL